VNCARSRRTRDAYLVPLAALGEGGDDGPAVDPHRFQPEGSRYAGHWLQAPEPWAEERLAAAQAGALVRQEIECLPTTQRAVITLRDVEGLESADVCAVLGITGGNQRVLLHRARSRVRAAVERLLAKGGDQ
jgi:RNA polymerase sigma-70 factor, ECF subfamily